MDRSLWFSDGYGDYIRHFLIAMAAVPEWVPKRSDHVLRSSSLVTKVAYKTKELRYQTFDPQATEVLRLSFSPGSVTAGSQKLTLQTSLDTDGFTVAPLGEDFVVRVRHSSSGDVRVVGE